MRSTSASGLRMFQVPETNHNLFFPCVLSRSRNPDGNHENNKMGLSPRPGYAWFLLISPWSSAAEKHMRETERETEGRVPDRY
jgi:hypothetical protein